jgi:hypothetical protein
VVTAFRVVCRPTAQWRESRQPTAPVSTASTSAHHCDGDLLATEQVGDPTLISPLTRGGVRFP